MGARGRPTQFRDGVYGPVQPGFRPLRHLQKGTSTLFNPDWGGYAGETTFELASFEQPTDFPVAHWREQDVDYAILHYDVYDRNCSKTTHLDYLRETTRLKGWEHQPNYRWVTMVVLLLYPIQQEATGQLGPIRLIGYELAEGSARPGQSIPFHLYWQAETADRDGLPGLQPPARW